MGSGAAYDVFLSYARSDSAGAVELNRWLRAQGLRTFFDRSELKPGLRWIPALEDAIGRSAAVAILVGQHGFGNTQQYERELALVRQTRDDGFPVIPVLMPGCKNPPTGFLQLLTWVDLSQDNSVLQQPESLDTLLGAIHGQAVSQSSIRSLVCPYRGLEPFREEDATFFCGRDDAIRDLVAKVQQHSFVAVVGPSGSGKSSLVFAGLLPALRQERQTTMWDVVSLRPGEWPLDALAEAFGAVPANAGQFEIDAWLKKEAALLRAGDAEALARVVVRRLNAATEKPDRLLIYVDQWEELYAMAPRPEDRERHQQHAEDVEKFIALLVAAASGGRSRAKVVLTARADFYTPLIKNPLLSTLLPRQQVNIPPMSEEDIRSAIETPAKKAGLSFAPPELVDQILEDVGTQEGRLPLLQFALKETWEQRTGDQLTAGAYTRVGGVTGAIEKTAQDAYNRLTPAQQEAARHLFLRLVTPGEGQEDTRARSLIPDDPQQREIIELFSNPKTRLLVTAQAAKVGAAQTEDASGATVEVAHEALIRRWSTLRAWVDASREKLRSRTAILRAKAEWEENSQNESYLLDPGVQLERARALTETPGDVPVDDIRTYVELSIDKEKRRLDAINEAALAHQKSIAAAERRAKEAAEEVAKAEKARAEEAQAAKRKQQKYLIAAASAAVLAAIAFVLAVIAQGQAVKAQAQAEEQLKLARDTLKVQVTAVTEDLQNDAGIQNKTLIRLLDRTKSSFEKLLSKLKDDARFGGDRAEMLHDYGEAYIVGEDISKAESSFNESLGQFVELLKKAPSELEWRRGVAQQLDLLGLTHSIQEQRARARTEYDKSLELREEIAKVAPKDWRTYRDIASSQYDLGEHFMAIDKPEIALDRFHEAQDYTDKAFALLKDDAKELDELRRRKARILVSLSQVYAKFGQKEQQKEKRDALHEAQKAALGEALEIRKQLYHVYQDDREIKRDLSWTYQFLGSLEFGVGDFKTAGQYFFDCITLRKEPAESDPSNFRAKSDLAWCYLLFGKSLHQLGRYDESIENISSARHLMEIVFLRDKLNARRRKDYSVSLATMGEVQLDHLNQKDALDSFQEARVILEVLITNDQESPFRKILADIYGGIGKAELLAGKVSAAEEAFDKALQLRNPSYSKQHDSVEFLTELAQAHCFLGELQAKRDERSSASGSYHKCKELARGLQAREEKPPEADRLLDQATKALKALSEGAGRRDQARVPPRI